jgi:hypothetical protein
MRHRPSDAFSAIRIGLVEELSYRHDIGNTLGQASCSARIVILFFLRHVLYRLEPVTTRATLTAGLCVVIYSK